MFRNKKKDGRLSIRKGATAKLIRTHDQKFRIIVFNGDDGYLGKGAQGKCYLGILKNQQNQKAGHDSDDEYNPQQIKQILASPNIYPVVVVKQITKNDKKLSQEEQYRKQIENLALATEVEEETNENLVKCYPYILTSEKHFYMVMEYCDGKSLDLLINRRLHAGKWFNFFEFLKIFADIVNGYYPLNKVNIMHQDLKPENIFIKGKNFKIGDFGLSFLMKSEKGFNRGGTPSYNGIEKYQMPPLDPSHKSDMYSIGVILFKLFYGFHPYYEKRQLDQYQAKQIEKRAKQRGVPVDRITITRWESFEIFVKFYRERQLKQRKPFVKKPHLKTYLYKKHENLIESLFSQKLPEFIRKLILKAVDHRPTFTEVVMFVKENKIEQILKDYQKITDQKLEPNDGFFDDLETETCSDIRLSINFTNLGKQVFIEDESEVQKKKAQIPQNLLKTLSWDKERKQVLMQKYPRIFELKEQIEQFNRLTRTLMQLQQEFSEFNLKEYVNLLRESMSIAETELRQEEESLDNELVFYEDKQMEVEFVVQKYLLSYLNYILHEIQKQIKQLNEAELELFYRDNVDLILQLTQKNKTFLEGELFLGESDYSDLRKSQKDLERIIIDEFLQNITLDKQNLLFVYYCLAILRIKDKLNQKRREFTKSKSELKDKQNYKHPPIEDNQTEQDIHLEKQIISEFLSNKNKQVPDAFFKEFQENIITELKKRNIMHMVNID